MTTFTSEKTLYEMFDLVNKQVMAYNGIVKDIESCTTYPNWKCDDFCLCKNLQNQSKIRTDNDMYVKKILRIILNRYLFVEYYYKKIDEIKAQPFSPNSEIYADKFYKAITNICDDNTILLDCCIDYLRNPEYGLTLINDFLKENEPYRLTDVI